MYNPSSLFIDHIEIPFLSDKPETFLYQSIMLYGSSRTGKSTIIQHIMFLLKDIIPGIIVINPTNKLNNSYTNIVPKQLIHEKITIELLKDIFDKQEVAKEQFGNSNNIKQLEEVYSYCLTKSNKNICEKMVKIYENEQRKIENTFDIHITEKKKKLNDLKELHNSTMINYYKSIIRENKDSLLNDNNVIDDHKKIVKYLDFNPDILLIFDDCASSSKEWGKFSELKELFFNGRHYHITTIISLQDDKLLPPDIRKNAFINIFTTKTCSNAFFDNKANSFTINDKRLYQKLSDFIFKIDNEYSGKNYKKMCYIRENDFSKIQYTIAPLHEDFKFGSKLLHQLCNECNVNSKKKDKVNNKFTKSFD